jgi:hypothetical protein
MSHILLWNGYLAGFCHKLTMEILINKIPCLRKAPMFWLHAHVLPAKFDIFCIQRMDLHHHDCYCNPQVTEVANQMLCAHMFLSQINIRSGMPHNCTYIAQSFPALADVSLFFLPFIILFYPKSHNNIDVDAHIRTHTYTRFYKHITYKHIRKIDPANPWY